MRAPVDGEILVAIIAGQMLTPVATVATAVDVAESIVNEVMRRTDERERPTGYRYECRHGHISTYFVKGDAAPPQEIDCEHEGDRSSDHYPCTKLAGLIGKTID